MKRLWIVAVLCTVFQAVTATSVHAMSWWDLEALSGPKFKGLAFDVRAACWKYRKPGEKPGEKLLLIGGILSLCEYEQKDRRRGSIDLNLGLLQSDPNVAFATGQAINLVTLGVSVSQRLARSVPFEIGAGVSSAWFSSKGMTSFDTLMLDARLDWRPLDWKSGEIWWQQILVLRGGFAWFPQGFTQAEFNATRPLHDRASKYFAIMIDSESAFRKSTLR